MNNAPRLRAGSRCQAQGILQWPHSGFHVHAGVGVPEDDRAFALRLARSCARNPVALERMTYDAQMERVTYRSDKADGVAVDGKPIWRSRDILPLDVRYRIDLSGNSARTTMIAGPLTVWQGVKQDINWSTVPR